MLDNVFNKYNLHNTSLVKGFYFSAILVLLNAIGISQVTTNPNQLLGLPITAQDINWNYNMGYRFTADAAGDVTQLGGRWTNGITHTVRLYAYPAGTLLASTNVTGTGDWNYVTITPVTLVAGNQYVVAVRLDAQSSGLYSGGAGLPQSSGGITINNSTYLFNSNNMPTNSITTNMYGQADITYQPCTYAGNLSADDQSIFPGDSTELSVTDNVGSIQWQSSTDGASFSDILGETGVTLSTGALSTTTYYRTYVTGGSCGFDTSSTIEIQVLDPFYPLNMQDPIVTGKDINWNYNMGYRFTADQNGDVTQLGGRWSAGVTHTVRLYAYPAGTLLRSINVVGTGDFNYADITPVSLTSGNQYVVAVRLDAQSSGYFSTFGTPVSSAGITINNSTYLAASNNMPTNSVTTAMYGQADIRFEPCTYAGLIVPDDLQVISGDSTNLRLLDAIGNIQWQISTDNVVFTDIIGETGDTLNTGALMQQTYYRTIVTGGSCAADTSDVVSIKILDPFYPLQSTGISTTAENINWNYNMGYRFTPNQNGNITELGGRWRDGITHTVRLYAYPAGTLLSSVNVTGTGDWAYSSITPVALTAGNQYVVAVRLDAQSSGFYTTVSTPMTSGEVTINNSTYLANSNNMPTNSITTNMYGQADVKFIPCVSGGTAQADMSEVCNGDSTNIVAQGATGTLQWQNSTDNINFTNITGATDSTLNTGPLAVKTYFRLLASAGCGFDTSNVDSVNVVGASGNHGLWTALVDSLWSNACNWDDGIVPISGDSVIIPFGIHPPVNIPTLSLKYLELNNTSGIDLSNDLTITEELVLTAGNIDLGSNILTLDDNTIITGGLSTSYIKTHGTGLVRKNYAVANGSTFTFPIGDNSNFSPIDLVLNVGTTIGPSAYVNVDVFDSQHSLLGTPASYIDRYWAITPNDITTADFNITATYANVDINGTEGDMFGYRYEASSGWTMLNTVNTASNTFSATNLTTFGDFTASDEVAILSDQSGDWNTGATWIGGIAPGASDNAIILSSHIVTLAANESVNSLTVNASGELATTGNRLTVEGNLQVNGSYDSNGELEFKGTSGAQTISGTIKFDNLTIDNTSGVNIISGSDSITGTLTLTNGAFNTNNSLVLISDASGTARIDEITGGSIVGNITMQRYIDAGATNWRFLTSAVSGTTLADFDDDIITSGFTGSDFPNWPTPSNPWVNIYFYDETVGGPVDNGYVAASNVTNPLAIGEGLWVWSGDTITGTQPFTVDMTGPANSGSINLPVSYTNSGSPSDDGWSMVGNPYASTIDWDDPSITKTGLNNAIYIWNPDLQQFASYVAGIGTNGGSRYIASSQAFWVQTNASSPVLQVTESSKTSNGGAFLREGAPTCLNIVVTNNHGQDETVINFESNASTGFDPMYDAQKLVSVNAALPVISTVFNDSLEFAINQLPEQSISIPLKVTTGTTGFHSIDFNGISNFNNTSCIIVEDLFTGTSYNLRDVSSFTVFMQDTTHVARFLITFGAKTTTSVDSVSCFGYNDGEISLEKHGSYSYDVYWRDGQGQIISSDTGVVGMNSVSNLSSGSYFIITNDPICGTLFDTISVVDPPQINVDFTTSMDTVYLSNGGTVDLINNSNNATYFLWDLGDGNSYTSSSPTHEYLSEGLYTVSLSAFQNSTCSETTSKTVTVLDVPTTINELSPDFEVNAWMNGNNLVINEPNIDRLEIRNMLGQLIHSNEGKALRHDLSHLSSQTIVITIVKDNQVFSSKLNYIKK